MFLSITVFIRKFQINNNVSLNYYYDNFSNVTLLEHAKMRTKKKKKFICETHRENKGLQRYSFFHLEDSQYSL